MNCENLHELEGLQFMPVKENKQPIVKGWQSFAGKHDLTNCAGVGLVCGMLSGGLEVVDIDLKYDITGVLYDAYKREIHKADESLLSKLVVQKTRGGGYHFIYRCSLISGNLKLANRPTTEDERKETYEKTYNAEILNGDDANAILKAKKASENDKVRVLLETRGIGGFIMCFPSKGYELVHNDYYSISEITPEQRNILHDVARSFNEVFEEVVVPKTQIEKKINKDGLSPFEDYNERGDVIGLLQNNGWKVVSNRGNKTHLLRPGQSTAQTSGNYDHNLKWFSVFTTSTEFEPTHGYRPYAVFAVLECNKNFSEASKKLYDMGYGDRHEVPKEKEKAPSTRVIQSRVNPDDDDYSFLATEADYDPYLKMVVDGTLPMGLTTGIPSLDEHWLFKEGSFVNINGHDNAGKSVVIWYLLLLASLLHGWKGIVFSSENSTGNFMRKMIQYFWGRPLRGYNAINQQEQDIAKDFIKKHFLIIKADEDMYNYKDILNMVKKAKKRTPELVFGLIDPYNSLKIDLSGFSKLSTHEFHYEALSEFKFYGQKNNFGWFINHHAITEALRKLDSDGFPTAPHKADTEGGGKVANKTDDFVTIHRKVQHPTDWNITELHVRKIKDTETGGKPTPLNAPVRLRMFKNQCGFEEVRLEGGQGIDAIRNWRIKNGYEQGEPQPLPPTPNDFDINF